MEKLKTFIEDLTSGEDERAEQAIPSIAAYGEEAGSEVLKALQPLLSDPDADIRWWAVRALAEVPHEQVPCLLVTSLEDEDINVRQCAALALRHQPTEFALSALVKAMKSKDALLPSLAADAMVAIGSQAVPDLLEVMASAPQPVRLIAVRALAMIGDPRSIPVLFEALSEDSALMEYWANEGLERMGVGMMFFKP